MSEELKPCPFCGSEHTQVRYMGGKWQEQSAFSSGFRGECCDCGVIEAEAARAWNARTERTCEYIGDEISGGCSVCRGWLDPDCAYCPSCGSRVVADER